MQSASPAPTIRVDPDLARVSIGLLKANLFRLWIIARSLTRRADGSGTIAKRSLKSALPAHDIHYTRQHINRLIAAGDGLFWNIGDERLFIRSSQFVSQRLTLEALATSPALVLNNRPGSRDMYVSLSGSLADWESQLYAAWMASRNNPTISRERLSALFNRTDETLRQWEAKRSEQLKVRTNYAQCADPESLPFTPPLHCRAYVATKDGKHSIRLRWQLPNTYLVSGYREHARRGQARKVRKVVNALLHEPADLWRGGLLHGQKRYFDKAERLHGYRKKYVDAAVTYLWLGENRWRHGIYEYTSTGYKETEVAERAFFSTERRVLSGT
jgi:hypothetical protein